MNKSIIAPIIGITVFLFTYGLTKISTYMDVKDNVIVVLLLTFFFGTISYFIDKFLGAPSKPKGKSKSKSGKGGDSVVFPSH